MATEDTFASRCEELFEDSHDDFSSDERLQNGSDSYKIDDEENTLRALFVTDTHLGFAENDPIRGQDSFESFEEALKIAVENDVDIILHGGDLFHENRPSKNTELRCIDIIRKYTYGKKKLKFSFLSPCYKTNFNDKNFSISYPVFAIHGNHDDRAGAKRVSALDVLHSAGLINLFGSNENVSVNIHNEPLILNKGKTNIGLYGLGSIRDERLFHQFEENLVTWNSEGSSSRFNIFLIHQNHVKHGATTKFIPEKLLPGFLDLVLWGHEHDAYPDPIRNEQRGFCVVQPGSSVATQLTHGEARQKFVTMFDIKGKSFKPYKIPLKTVRPFYIEDFIHSLHDIQADDPKIKEKTIQKCEMRVKEILKEHKLNSTNNKLPLVRLRVDYTKNGLDNFSNISFGQKFFGLIANSNEIINFTKSIVSNKSKINSSNKDFKSLTFSNNDTDKNKVELISDIFLSNINKTGGYCFFDPKLFQNCLIDYVDKDENHSFTNFIDKQMKEMSKIFKRKLNEQSIDIESFDEFYKKCLLSLNSNFNIDITKNQERDYQFLVNSSIETSSMITFDKGDEFKVENSLPKTSQTKPLPKKKTVVNKSIASSITRKSKTRQKTLFEIPDI